MRRFSLLFALLITTIGAHASSQWHLHVEGSALYWLPCSDSFQFAETGTLGQTNADRHVLAVGPTFRWGYRLGVGLWLCDAGATIEGDYTHFDLRTSYDPEPPFFPLISQNFLGFPGQTGGGRYRLRYDTVALRIVRSVPCLPGCLQLFASVRWAKIWRNERADLQGVIQGEVQVPIAETTANRCRFEGVGPGAGVKSSWNLWCGVHLDMHAGLFALVGDRSSDVEFPQQVFDVVTENSLTLTQHASCVAGTELRAALSYCLPMECFKAKVSVGYELEYYFDVLESYQFRDLTSQARMEHFGFTGPVLSFTCML